MKQRQGSRFFKWTTRLVLAALVITCPGVNFYGAMAAEIEVNTALQAGPKALPVLPATNVLTPISVTGPSIQPTAGFAELAIPTIQTPEAQAQAQTPQAMALVSVTAMSDLPTLQKPGAPATAMSAEAGHDFDATAQTTSEGSDVVESIPASAPTLSVTTQRVSVSPRAVPSPWRQKVRAAMPKVVLAAAIVGVTWLAHATGNHALLAGIVPLMAAGTMKDKAAGGDSQADKDEQLLGLVQGLRKPGEMLGPSEAADLGKKLGIDTADTFKTLGRLADQGHIVAFSNGYNLVIDLPKAEPDDAPVVEGRAMALEAAKLLNGDSTVDHMRALAKLQRAYMKYPKDSDDEDAEEARRQISYMRLNAAMEVLRDVITEHETTNTTAGTTEKAMIQDARQYLFSAYYDVHHVPYNPDQETHEVVSDILKNYQINRYSSHPDYKNVEAGYQVAKMVARTLGPKTQALSPAAAQNAPAPLLLPAPPGSKPGFNLISDDDKKYKSLNEFGTNLTGLAAAGQLKSLIGREKELRQVIKVLMRDEKNNPIVVGDAGVGKTQLVEGLAQKLVKGDVPADLKDKNIFKLNLNALVAGTTLRGQFEERVQKVLDEVTASKGRVILFIDEVHMVLGLGSAEGSHDLSQVLLDAMARGGISVIGATTLDRYRKIENSAALNRRFAGVMLNPNTKAESIQILSGRRERYEKKHKVKILDETIKAAVDYAARYITDRQPPDSALDLLDDAATEVQLTAEEAEAEGKEGVRTVTPNDIAKEIALRMEIPVDNVSANDREMLKAMPERLEKRVVGQKEAVQALTRAVRKSRLGYKDPNRPDMYLFLGPTGVGKTEMAKALAEMLFGSEAQMTPIDMSEYGEKQNVARLISAPPGYVGHEEGGQLTEPVRRKPRQIILLDEIDKAHPDVYNVLLQMAEEGRLTDGQGRRVNFKETIIIITANFEGAHSADEREPMGFRNTNTPKPPEKKAADQKEKYLASIKGHFKPELINRIGKQRIIVFNELTADTLAEIARIREADLNKRLADKDMTIRLTEAAVKRMVDDASTPANLRYGARPLRDIIEEEILNAAADAELEGTIANGDRVIVDYDPAKGWVVSADKSKK
jgi:ATP-dependent Clp protease ATP-binding subunit ClpC